MRRRHQVSLKSVNSRLVTNRVELKKHLALLNKLIIFVGDFSNNSRHLWRDGDRYHCLLRGKSVRVVVVHQQNQTTHQKHASQRRRRQRPLIHRNAEDFKDRPRQRHVS